MGDKYNDKEKEELIEERRKLRYKLLDLYDTENYDEHKAARIAARIDALNRSLNFFNVRSIDY